MLNLASLPNEILIDIIQYLYYASDVNSISQACHRLWQVADPWLYDRYALDCSPRGLERITANGNTDALRRLFAAGAGFPHGKESTLPHRPRNQFVPFDVATANGHLNIARLLVEVYGSSGVDISLSFTNNSPFFNAIQGGHCDVIRYLLDVAAPPNRLGYIWPSNSAVIPQISRNCPPSFLKSIVEGPECDINAPSEFGIPLLWRMVEHWSPDAVEVLLDAGADPMVEHRCAGYYPYQTWMSTHLTPLYNAVFHNREEMVRRLLKRGTKEYLKTGLKPEFLARMLETHGPSVPCLILEDIFEPWRLCDSESDLLYMLNLAAANGDAQLVRQILDMSSTKASNSIDIALGYAAQNGHINVVEILLPSELSENGQVPQTYLMAISKACKGKQSHVIDLLLERVGPELWTLSKELTRDGLAKSGEDIKFTRYLLEKNAFALSGPMDREILCHGAMEHENFALLEYFLNELGIPSFKYQTKGIGGSCRFEAIFREAVITGSIDVFKFLLDREPVLDPNNPNWGNILVEATSYNHLDIVNLFLDNGFDVNTRYRISGTPEDSGWRSDSESNADPPGNAELTTDMVVASSEFPPIRYATILEAAIFYVIWPACMFDIGEDDPPKIGMVRLLLDRGADIYTVNSKGQYLFECHTQKGQSAVILQEFLSRGVSPLMPIRGTHESLWSYAFKTAIEVSSPGHWENASLLSQCIMDQGLPCEVFRSLIPCDDRIPVNMNQLAGEPLGGLGEIPYRKEYVEALLESEVPCVGV
ncbi:ankyrin repeat-containing domain protein [Penicillium waksmanii]|uniref:ankyrin repeat-containing domain protein n=1 Tax=Penicillium waksmanii TaxID=69791 RepID=UPI002547FF1A|nr:ankyrin repeat-containing domain protein [Penicillium waksmanii]KAJ6000325.1 ankyrin repeat-containing domain protein [Penicillium waksmanii]